MLKDGHFQPVEIILLATPAKLDDLKRKKYMTTTDQACSHTCHNSMTLTSVELPVQTNTDLDIKIID